MVPNRILKAFSRVFFALACLSVSAFAQTDIYIRGSGHLFPVAVPQLCLQNGETSANRDIPKIVGRDLDLSGYFEVLNSGSYVETPGKCAGPDGFAYSDWSVIGAEGLVRGVVRVEGDQVKVQLYLHNVQLQKIVLGKEYQGDASQIPLMAHKFANEVMRYFTGEPGIFGTPIVFTGKVGRFKELFQMQLGDEVPRQLTNDHSLSISSSYAPGGKELLFTSYRPLGPDLFNFDLTSKRESQITKRGRLIIGAKYSPDGRTIAASLTEDRDSDIVLLDSSGKLLKRVTSANGAIDVSPDWSPDGSRIVFCSNRSGGPQIYTMGADGSNPQRISFVSSSYCTSPDWSPKGDKIAFVCRVESRFQTFVVNADGSNPVQLTSVGDNEDPDWSPDGRYLIFATTFGKAEVFNLALMRADGSSVRQLTQARGGGDTEPAWGPSVP